MYSVNKDKVFSRKVDDETVLLNIDTGYYYTLDEMGSLVWQELLDEKEEDTMVEDIVSKYDVDRRVAKKDLSKFIKDLAKEDLLESKK